MYAACVGGSKDLSGVRKSSIQRWTRIILSLNGMVGLLGHAGTAQMCIVRATVKPVLYLYHRGHTDPHEHLFSNHQNRKQTCLASSFNVQYDSTFCVITPPAPPTSHAWWGMWGASMQDYGERRTQQMSFGMPASPKAWGGYCNCRKLAAHDKTAYNAACQRPSGAGGHLQAGGLETNRECEAPLFLPRRKPHHSQS